VASPTQHSRDIASALGDRDDFYVAGPASIDDEISANGPEEDRLKGKVDAPMSKAGVLGERGTRVEEFVDPTIQRSAASMLSCAMYYQISSRSNSTSGPRT